MIHNGYESIQFGKWTSIQIGKHNIAIYLCLKTHENGHSFELLKTWQYIIHYIEWMSVDHMS